MIECTPASSAERPAQGMRRFIAAPGGITHRLATVPLMIFTRRVTAKMTVSFYPRVSVPLLLNGMKGTTHTAMRGGSPIRVQRQEIASMFSIRNVYVGALATMTQT